MTPRQLWAHALSFAEFRLAVAMAAVSLLAALFSGTDPGGWLRGVALGLALWIAAEYLLHRFVLHLPLPEGAPDFARVLHRRVHHGHHLDPRDPALLFVPAWASPGLLAMAFGVGSILGAGFVCAATYALCLVLYERAHLVAHVPFQPRTRYGRWMKRHHLLHHYKNERWWFGVTHPLMDWVLGTWPDPTKIEKSSTARDLGGHDPAA